MQSVEPIRADPSLVQAVREDGQRLFGDNCAACHGTDAKGGTGFPNLTDRDSLWGSAPDALAHTIAVGVNSSASKETRVSQMLAFGRDGILDNNSVLAVTDYVRSLSDPGITKGSVAASVAAGRRVFAANCVACHGPDGRGNMALGVPNLADRRGFTAETRSRSTRQSRKAGREKCRHGRTGLTKPTKILLVYLLDKGGKQ